MKKERKWVFQWPIKMTNKGSSYQKEEDISIIYPEKILDELLARNDISENGAKYYEIGRSKFYDNQLADDYANNSIKPFFEKLKTELLINIDKQQNFFLHKLENLNNKIASLNEEFDNPKNGSTFYNLKNEYNFENEKNNDYKSIANPELKYQSYIKGVFDEFKINLDKIANNNDDSTIIETALKQKEISIFSENQLEEFRNHNFYFRGLLNSNRLISGKFKYWYISFGYFFCFLLLVSEIGFTYAPLKKIQKDGGFDTWVIYFFAIGISLSTSVIYKKVYDIFKVNRIKEAKNKKILVSVWRLLIILFHMTFILVLTYFFSQASKGFNVINSNNVVENNWLIDFIKDCFSQKSFLYAFYTSNFALANAFLFTKIDSMGKINNILNFKIKEKEVKEKENEIKSKIENLEFEKKEIEHKISKLINTNYVVIKLSAIEKNSISEFYSGYSSKTFDSFWDNSDLMKINYQLTKNKISNNEKQ